MIARAVIGANFGDEGKGLITDYVATKGGNVVVRYNGGAQAGHTVVTPHNERHVFGHIGSGAFWGLPTYLSEFFVCNPLLFFYETDQLQKHIKIPDIYAHPSCLISTFVDMLINRRLEFKRGIDKHGSCGIGFGETIERSNHPKYKLTMGDLWYNFNSVESKVDAICNEYAPMRIGRKVDEPYMAAAFLSGCEAFAHAVHPLGIQQCTDPIFEGSQGLLLDQDNKDYFPHVTRSNTGMKNIKYLCAQAGIDKIEPYYVSRTYLTRHGAGPLPGENPELQYTDKTNIPNGFQGKLRFATLNIEDLFRRCREDSGGKFKLAMTHCDQVKPACAADLYSYGDCRTDVFTSMIDGGVA